MTAPAKRRVGRPRKQPENPDCEVATRGYVKCVARNISHHNHKQRCFPIITLLLSVSSVAIWVLSLNQFALGLAIVSTAVLIDLWFVFDNRMETREALLDNPEAIQKYEPPCEPKRGCDEQEG